NIPPIRLTDYDGNYQSHPGWAVGYSLLLACLFSIFGYDETAARWVTILICSLVIPMIGILGNRLQGKGLGIIAAFLVAANPLLICINGRILTANLGYCFLVISICFLILGTTHKQGDVEFIDFEELISSTKPLFYLSLSFLFFGLTLMARDDFAMFALIFPIIFWRILRKSGEKIPENRLFRLFNYIKLMGIAVFFFLVGYFPNIYFNYQTYGKTLTSSHYEYGGRLSFEYFLKGSSGAFGLPGWAVIILTIIIFAFPVISVFFVVKKSRAGALIGSIMTIMVLPILFINGSYPVTSSGASARYIIPLIPFISISTGILLVQKGIIRKFLKYSFIVCLIIWHVVLIYPPTILFKPFPKLAYLTQYSPLYNKQNYINYPHPVRETLQWVKSNTLPNTIILSDYDSYHYFFYALRDVMNRECIKEIKKQLNSRPVFFIEDHPISAHPELLKDWKEKLAEHLIVLKEKDSIPLFTPEKGEVRLRIYELNSLLGKDNLFTRS
ncbi:MAG: glycosyltransferase family 39 protein, partial [Spirochaetota bacterium]|nr:glycosyltransferase family 39 protein [Spirochaetota bacterium]